MHGMCMRARDELWAAHSSSICRKEKKKGWLTKTQNAHANVTHEGHNGEEVELHGAPHMWPANPLGGPP